MGIERRGAASARGARRLLSMVAELHKQGYQRLRIIPGMAPSGVHWRCAITASSNVVGPHGLEEGPADRLIARYSTADDNTCFGWRDAERADPRGLARLFVERFPNIAREAAGEDRAYAGWFVNVLGLAELGLFPIAYSDFGTEVTDVMPLMATCDHPGPESVLRPPPHPIGGQAMGVEVDLVATRNRIRRLRRYVDAHLLHENRFICPAHEECRSSCRQGDSFREGTMSHVGRRFDLSLDNKPLRIVVVGQESGWPKDPQLQRLARRVSLDDRYRQIHDTTGLQRRYYTEPGHPARNPHMRGTTSAMRMILGKGLGSDHQGEFVRPTRGKPFHIFDGFALVNRLLCSAGPPDSSQGRPTSTMFQNCGSHFAATMSILEPSLVISQGRAVAKWVNQLLPPDRSHGPHLHEAHMEYGRVLVCTFSHPSAHGSLRWGDRLDAPYLTDVVAPTLIKAISLT